MAAPDFDTPYRGGFVGDEHHYALTVYFEDTDAGGVVYHANYIRFLERARSDMLRAAGADHVGLHHEGGGSYVVAEVHIRYRQPARLGDDLLVISTVDQVRASSVLIHQRVMRGKQQLTDARVTAAFLDGEGRPRRQPKDWVEKFNSVTTQGS